MKLIKEIEYKKFLDKDVLDYLDTKVKEPYNGHRDLPELISNAMTSLPLIKKIEEDFIPSLEELAVSLVKEAFPIIEQEGIEIEAKIGTSGETEFEEDEIEPDSPDEEPEEELNVDDQAKRRITNALTQGSSVRGSYIYNMMKDELDVLDERLFDSYNKLLKSTYGLYDFMNYTPEQVKQLAQSSGDVGAMGKVKVMVPKPKDEDGNEDGKIKIKAVAQTFPFLIHEIIKGLYEIISLSGFTNPNKEYNQKVMSKVDTLFNEIDDLKFGKYIYDAVNRVLGEYTSDKNFDARIREYFLQEMYKIEDSKEFIILIQNIIMNRLTSSQKKWIQDTIKDIIDDLKYDDNPLDENFQKKNTHDIILTINEIGLKRFKIVPTFKNLLHPSQLNNLKIGDNELTVNNTVWSTLQRMSDNTNISVKKKLKEVKLFKKIDKSKIGIPKDLSWEKKVDLINSKPLLNLKLGKYNLSGNEHGDELKIDIESLIYQKVLNPITGNNIWDVYSGSATWAFQNKLYGILGIKPLKLYIGYVIRPQIKFYSSSIAKSFYIFGYYNDEPIVIARKETQAAGAGQTYLISKNAKLKLLHFIDSPKEEILASLGITP
jgi:hypothetical protein